MNGTDAGLAVTTMLVVAALRKHFPKLDGMIVLLVVLVVAAAVVAASGPIGGWAELVRHAGIVFLLAIGANAWAGSIAEKAAPASPLAPLIAAAGPEGTASLEQTTTATVTKDADATGGL